MYLFKNLTIHTRFKGIGLLYLQNPEFRFGYIKKKKKLFTRPVLCIERHCPLANYHLTDFYNTASTQRNFAENSIERYLFCLMLSGTPNQSVLYSK